MDKPSLRKMMASGIRKLEGKEGESRVINGNLKSNEAFRKADVILSFYPMKDEPDITSIIDERFLFPYIKDGKMEFGRLPLSKSTMGFMEPVDKTPVSYDSAVILVPGRAFTKEGKRLGRGGGFYDRYLSQNKEKLHSIGVCFSVQLLSDIPSEAHDELIDEVVTSI